MAAWRTSWKVAWKVDGDRNGGYAHQAWRHRADRVGSAKTNGGEQRENGQYRALRVELRV